MNERKEAKPIFKKIIDEFNEVGALKRQITVYVSLWKSSDFVGYIKGDPIKKGYTLQIKVLHLDGNKTKEFYIRLDPLNKELRQTLKEMFATVDEEEYK